MIGRLKHFDTSRIPRKWARLYLIVLETVVLFTYAFSLITDTMMRPNGFEPGVITTGIFVTAFFLLLLTSPFLLRIERWLGITAIATALILFTVSMLLPPA